MKKTIYILTAILLTLACGGSDRAEVAITRVATLTTEGAPATEAPPPAVAPRVGDTVIVGDWSVTVNEVLFPPGERIQPDEGMKYVVIDLTVSNTSGEQQTLSSVASMTLKDATGQQYRIDLGATVGSGNAPGGTFNSGETIRGQAGYEIPEGATGLQFVFERGERVIFELE